MTALQILRRLHQELDDCMVMLMALRVHDERIRGQLEMLRHLSTVLESLGASAWPEPVPTRVHTKPPAPPRRATRAVKKKPARRAR